MDDFRLDVLEFAVRGRRAFMMENYPNTKDEIGFDGGYGKALKWVLDVIEVLRKDDGGKEENETA